MTTTIYENGQQVTVYDGGNTVVVKAGSPPGAQLRYRCDHKYLFQHVRSRVEKDRIRQGDSNDWEQDGTGTQGQLRCQPVGGPTTADHIDFYIGWAFDSKGKGGDWIDKRLARNPATPLHWLALPVNSGAKQYTIDATDALRFIQQNDRYNAWSFNRSGAVRTLSGSTAGNAAPYFSVDYADGTHDTLTCRVTAMLSTSTAYPFTLANQAGLPQFDLPVVAEFEPPTKPVASAAFVFTIATTNTSASTFVGNILDPKMNADPVTLGVAKDYPADNGLAGHVSIINVHQYLDSAPESDFIDRTQPQNTDDEKNISPDMIWTEHTGNPVPGPYVKDLTKYPYSSSGVKQKWIGMTATNGSQFAKVLSTYDKEGFEPLQPGLGAIRSFLPHLPGIKDGTVEQSASWQTILTRIWLPANQWGQRTLFTRYYMRLGTPQRTGDPLGPPAIPYRMPIAERYQVFNSSGHWIFTDCHGKTGISPEQVTGYGGFSGTAGGHGGTQFRLSFGDFTSADDGPDVGGLALGWHLYDFAARNPPGYQYNGDNGNLTQFGQRGGLGGIIYGNQWYCLETQVTLNTVRDGSGAIVPNGFIPDGELRAWMDGRLVFERTGMVFRALPYSYGGSKWGSMSFVDPGYNKALRRQCRDLGHIAVMCNEYHGGVTQNNVNRTKFYTGLAYGTQYIGPMR